VNAGKLVSLLGLTAGLVGASCTENPAAYRDILGPFRPAPPVPSGGAAGSGGTGGAGTGGVAAGGSAGTGGASTSGAGGTSGEGGMGESGAGAIGGSPGGKGGASGKGGTGATGAAGHPPVDPNFSPACFEFTTTTGEEILKGTPCTAEDPKLCYRPCGPNQIGWKTETCTAGVYAEGDCTFPSDKDYSCYKIPDEIDASACGLGAPPAATDPCTAPLCMPCNLDGFYEDTGSDAKEGFCVCREPDAEGVRRWTCASTTAWPCPFSQGC
jgi:hypothetical protein